VLTTVVVPPIGSLGAISGVLTGGAAGAHHVCVYKESGAATLWGPLLETPVSAATGAFHIAGWVGSDYWDSVSPRFFLLPSLNTFVCPVAEGTQELPATLYAASPGWAIFARAAPVAVEVTSVPIMGAIAGPIVAHVTGLPDAVGGYAAAVYGMNMEGWLVGPLVNGICGAGAAHPLIAGAVAGSAGVSIANWQSPGVDPSSFVGFQVVVYRASFPIDATVCLNQTSRVLSVPAGLPAIASGFGVREEPASTSPSQAATPSSTPAVSPSSAVIEGQGTPSAEPIAEVDTSGAGAAHAAALAVSIAVAVVVSAFRLA
jgi:hypothetical protein